MRRIVEFGLYREEIKARAWRRNDDREW